MKIIWQGSLSFGLVSIPIKLYPAIQEHALGFTMLHATCQTPLEYHRWCPKCQKEVVWNDTVKGFKTSKGFLILSQDMLKKLRPETTETLNIVEFIEADQLNDLYMNHHYYIAPARSGNNGYALFLKALEKLDKIAIGRFIMHDKEYTCAIRPHENYLLLTTLHYSYEIKALDVPASPVPKYNAQELKLAEQLINTLSVKKFDITKFKDTFAQEIKALLKAKSKKKTAKATAPVKKIARKKPTLSDQLRKSIETVPLHAKTKRSKR